jgi:hypothetical protein
MSTSSTSMRVGLTRASLTMKNFVSMTMTVTMPMVPSVVVFAPVSVPIGNPMFVITTCR